MKIVKFILPVCTILLAGCSSLPSVSSKDAGDFVSAISAPGVSHIEKIEEWLQPENKDEACLLSFGSESGQKWWGEPNERIIWDGECRDGYAYGLGREFYEGKQGLVSTLAEYSGGRTRPANYYSTKHDSSEYYFGEKSGLVFKVFQSSPISYSLVQYALGDGGASYVIVSDIAGNSHVRKIFPSGYEIVFSEFADPATLLKSKVAVLKGGVPVNYVVEVFRNGMVNHIDVSGDPRLIRLPQSYLDFLNETYRETRVSAQGSQKAMQEAEVAINRYKRRICAGDVEFQGVDSKVYGQICLPGGELGKYVDEINIARDEIKERYEATALRQKAAAENLAAQNAALQSQSVNNLNRQLQDFSSSMRDFSNSMYDYNMQNSNKVMQGGGVFGSGGSDTYRTNCYQTANIISCKTR